MNQNSLKVGLIGLGNMGRNHLRVLTMLKGVELIFVADADAKQAEKLGNANNVPGVKDPTSFLSKVDAVIICTPTVTHFDYINLAAKYVKNIFVEKPLTSTLAQAEEIVKLAQIYELNIQVGFIERFNPAVQSLKTVLQKSERIINLDFTRTNKISSRITDVDVITDLMIHDIDLALFINGPAKSIASHGFAHGKMIDFASALITHENGQFSRVQASRVTDKKIRKIEATCVDMFVDCDLLRKEIIINKQSETTMGDDLPYTISAIQEAVAVKPQEALLTELQAFVASCNGQNHVDVPGIESGLNSMKICHEIQSQFNL